MAANLPRDVIELNILNRLPVKTLIRFTSVCKLWYSLLSDPYFINLHNLIQENKTNNLFLVDYALDNSIVVKDKDSCWKESLSSLSDIANLPPYEGVDVVGCCNGIVCVFGYLYNASDSSYRHHISLWNPALRINNIIDIDCYKHACIGFGYHNQTNDYKVIRFSNALFRLDNVEVYSFTTSSGSGSWRKLSAGATDHRYSVKMFGLYVSCYPGGAYCWTARKYHNGSYGETRIISFHMEEEAFKEMALPYTSHPRRHQKCTLFICKDSLAVLYTTHYPVNTMVSYIWVMKEYNQPNSWTKLWKFDSQGPFLHFVGFIETDEIILLQCSEPAAGGVMSRKVDVLDIYNSQLNPTSYTKDISFLKRARWVGSITESLALLQRVTTES